MRAVVVGSLHNGGAMRVLVLGRTRFVGRAAIAEAVHRGWTVTAFNRGVSGAGPAGVDLLRGDRLVDADLAAPNCDVVAPPFSNIPALAQRSDRCEDRPPVIGDKGPSVFGDGVDRRRVLHGVDAVVALHGEGYVVVEDERAAAVEG